MTCEFCHRPVCRIGLCTEHWQAYEEHRTEREAIMIIDGGVSEGEAIAAARRQAWAALPALVLREAA